MSAPNLHWLIQIILQDEVISKLDELCEDEKLYDALAWKYTERLRVYVPVSEIMDAMKELRNELYILEQKHLKEA